MSEENKEPQSKLLERLFTERLSGNWRKKVKLEVRADTLYWFFRLIERGIEGFRDDYTKENRGKLDACSVASLVSFQADLEKLLKQVEASLPPEKT